ncbi:MAG: fatty acid desaturase family protein [Planctomycetota bacterium]|jgi:fatty acid desaturase
MSAHSTRLAVAPQTNQTTDNAAARQPSNQPSQGGNSRRDNPLKTARAEVADLFTVRPWIYWTDFLVNLVIGFSACSVLLKMPSASWEWKAAAWVVAAITLYRVSLFMHEVCHFGKNEMRGFKIAWNVLAGIPMMLPSFFYETHREHHNTHHYGTEEDGEYLPLASGRFRDLFAFFAQVLYLPLITYFRHLIITPLSFLIPSLRTWVLEHWSSFVINLSYKRTIRAHDPVRWWAAMEVACHLRAATLAYMILSGIDPWYNALLIWSMASAILLMNHVRTLAAHRYQSGGNAMTLEGQLLDSIDISARDPLTLILCPVGLRYHALHHMFPGMPYHNLGAAHRRLVARLPADHPYHSSVYPSIWTALGELVSEIKRNRQQLAEQPRQKLSADQCRAA